MRSGRLFRRSFLLLTVLMAAAAGGTMWALDATAVVPEFWDQLRDAGLLLVLITLAILGLAAAGARVLTRSQSEAIGRLAAAASRLSDGDLATGLPGPQVEETAPLARSLKRMRERLAGQLETIDRQRRTLERLLAQLHEGVVVAWPNGRIAQINPAAVRLLNPTPPDEPVYGQPAAKKEGGGDAAGAERVGTAEADAVGVVHVFLGRPVERCIAHHDLQRLLLAGGSHAEGPAPVHEVRLRVQGPTGPTTVLARASDIFLPDSIDARGGPHQATARMVVLTDITEFERTVQLKTDFVANASHELRTPVSAIRGSVETLLNLDLATDAAAVRRFLEMIKRHSERLDQMVADLLDLSRLETPSAEFHPMELNLNVFLEELHGRFAEGLEAGKLDWRMEVGPGGERLVASPELLRLALDNLVDNAIKFTAPGGCVRVTATREADSIRLEVADDGRGIPEDEQERVFERFYQVDAARSGAARGTGLGLAIVKHAVAALRGTVELRSEPGRGTRVMVSIPSPAGAAS